MAIAAFLLGGVIGFLLNFRRGLKTADLIHRIFVYAFLLLGIWLIIGTILTRLL